MLNILNSTDDIRNVSWKTLHEWVQKYPYAQHLRLIAARKAKLENNIDLQVLLEIAATYAPSRRFLYEYLAAPQHNPIIQTNMNDNNTVNTIVTENINKNEGSAPIVDNTDIAAAEVVMPINDSITLADDNNDVVVDTESIADDSIILADDNNDVVVDTESIADDSITLADDNNDVVVDTENIADSIVTTADGIVSVADSSVTTADGSVTTADGIVSVADSSVTTADGSVTTADGSVSVADGSVSVAAASLEEVSSVSTQINTESDSFGNWLALLGGIAMPAPAPKVNVPLPQTEDEHEDLEDINAENEVRHLAQRSVETNHDIISETLAKLLEIQGKNAKAIEMYQQLMLKHPDKAAVFATRIADLEQK